MADLRIGELGFIAGGQEAGRWVEVVDDQAESGGYFIFTYGDCERSGESLLDVERQFDFWSWEVWWSD
jgi:hypothetical protein